VERHNWKPSDFGIAQASIGAIQGGDRDENCAIAREIFAGQVGPRRDIVLVNAAAALVAAGRAASLRDGITLAQESLDTGNAARKVLALAAFSQAQL
jgi:anthranilate phosphoribosyltransferase